MYLLIYFYTKRALLGSRRRFGENKGFSDEDWILIENLYVIKVCEDTYVKKTY